MVNKFANVSLKQKKITKGTHNYATNLGKHLLRDTIDYYKLADPNDKNKNKILIGMEEKTLAQSLNSFLKKHKLETRNVNTVQAYQLVFSIPKELKNDPDKIKKFQENVLEFINTDPKFKDNCLLCVYHGDEVQPHIQAVMVPRCHDNTLNFKRMLGGLNGSLKLHKLHDDFHSEVSSKLGLARGDGTHTTGLDQKRYMRAVAHVAAPTQVPDQVEQAEDSLNPYRRIKSLENENETLRKNNKVLSKGINKVLFYETQNLELKKANGKLRKIKKNLEEKFMKISDEYKERLRQIPCEEVLEKLGYEVKKEGSTFRCRTEDLNVVITDNKFYDNKSDAQGFGAISLLVDLLKFSFTDAIKYLSNSYGSESTAKVALANAEHTKAIVKNNVEKIGKEIPKPNANNLKKVIDYLVNVRKIKKEIVEDLIGKNLLYADKNSNCVFTNLKNTFAFQRGTYEKKKFVSVVGVPDLLTYEFGKTNNIYLFESAIDALSFRSLYPNEDGKYLVSNGSMMINKIHEVIDKDSKVFLCFDNDEQGKKFCDKISSELVNEVSIITPTNKDFNEDIVNGNHTATPTKKRSIKLGK